MTRKDFELIAITLCNSLTHAGYPSAPAEQWREVENTIYRFADMLTRSNVRFDRARFLKVCGVVCDVTLPGRA